jgi:hypothetical protein
MRSGPKPASFFIQPSRRCERSRHYRRCLCVRSPPPPR